MHVEKGICTWQSGLWPQDMGLDGFVWLFLLGAPDLFLCVGSMALEKEAPIICTNVPYDCGLYYFAKHEGQVHEMISHVIHASLFAHLQLLL